MIGQANLALVLLACDADRFLLRHLSSKPASSEPIGGESALSALTASAAERRIGRAAGDRRCL